MRARSRRLAQFSAGTSALVSPQLPRMAKPSFSSPTRVNSTPDRSTPSCAASVSAVVIAHRSRRPRTAALSASVRSSAEVPISGQRSGRRAAAAVRSAPTLQNSLPSTSRTTTPRPTSANAPNNVRHASWARVTTRDSINSYNSSQVRGSGMTCAATSAIASDDTVPISLRSTGRPRRNGTDRLRRSIASASSRNVNAFPTNSS